ncbi:MAG: type II toxin-antitoxin system VapC family toxin [Chloroflexi bacterium]|nr:type II toxin-antitoxin system VapC family toxin [Chloroflexota bacterium]
MTVDKVVDASVLVAFAFGEPQHDRARDLLSDVHILAPNLVLYELANAAVKKINAEPANREKFLDSLGVALRLQIDLRRVPATPTAELALRAGLTAYDAAYLYLALDLDLPLLTFDTTLDCAYQTIARS